MYTKGQTTIIYQFLVKFFYVQFKKHTDETTFLRKKLNYSMKAWTKNNMTFYFLFKSWFFSLCLYLF